MEDFNNSPKFCPFMLQKEYFSCKDNLFRILYVSLPQPPSGIGGWVSIGNWTDTEGDSRKVRKSRL